MKQIKLKSSFHRNQLAMHICCKNGIIETLFIQHIEHIITIYTVSFIHLRMCDGLNINMMMIHFILISNVDKSHKTFIISHGY